MSKVPEFVELSDLEIVERLKLCNSEDNQNNEYENHLLDMIIDRFKGEEYQKNLSFDIDMDYRKGDNPKIMKDTFMYIINFGNIPKLILFNEVIDVSLYLHHQYVNWRFNISDHFDIFDSAGISLFCKVDGKNHMHRVDGRKAKTVQKYLDYGFDYNKLCNHYCAINSEGYQVNEHLNYTPFTRVFYSHAPEWHSWDTEDNIETINMSVLKLFEDLEICFDGIEMYLCNIFISRIVESDDEKMYYLGKQERDFDHTPFLKEIDTYTGYDQEKIYEIREKQFEVFDFMINKGLDINKIFTQHNYSDKDYVLDIAHAHIFNGPRYSGEYTVLNHILFALEHMEKFSNYDHGHRRIDLDIIDKFLDRYEDIIDFEKSIENMIHILRNLKNKECDNRTLQKRINECNLLKKLSDKIK